MHWQQLSDNLSGCSYNLLISLLILSADLCIILILCSTLSVLQASDFCHQYSFAFFSEFLLYFLCRQLSRLSGFSFIIIIIIVAVAMSFPCQNHSTSSPYTSSYILLTKRTNGLSLGSLQKAVLFRKSGSVGWTRSFTFSVKV